MYRLLLLLAGFLFYVRAQDQYDISLGPPRNPWPTATLVTPPSGILIVGEGRSTEITFNVDGDPFPRDKTWYKDGNKITASSNINIDESGGNLYTLKFNTISKADEGTYYTIVKNVVSLEASKSPEVILKVSFLSEIWDTSRSQVVQARPGEYAVLECRPPDHFGAYPAFVWNKGSEVIIESDNMYISEYGNLVILQVAYEHYASDYRCTITIDSLKEGLQTRQGPAVSLDVVGSSASYVAPQIALKPVDLSIDAQIKETFRVECAVNGYPNLPSIKWYKDNVQITSSSVIYDLQKRNYLRITIPRSGGSVGGTYRCEAYDGSNQIYASANIQIFTKPIITTGLPTAEVKKSSGSELALSCVATSTPVPTYVWYKNAAELSPNINTRISGGSLTVSNVNSLNRGVYQCQAENAQGSTISTGMIRVQERLTFVIRPEDVEVYLGTAATFNCQGKGNPGPESLQWQFNGGNPPTTHEYSNNIVNQATYKIPRVTSSERDGRISCIISSPTNLYPTDTATAILTIREGPQVKAHTKNVTVTEGSSVDLACTVQNAGTGVSWKWLFEETLITQPDDFRITIHHNLLIVRGLTSADQGTYTCQADENGLSNHDNMFVMVKTFPRVELDPDVRIGEGVDARLTCRVTGNPTPAIVWRRNGQLIRDSDPKYRIEAPAVGTSILVVERVNKATDVGQYTCYGTNELGDEHENVNLIVVAACEVMNVPEDQEVEYQASVIISCTVNNCPAALWTWRKNGQLITFHDSARTINRGQAIELVQVVPSDGGEYSCTVDSNNHLNKRGTYNATITVKVDAKITSFPESRVLYKGGDPVELKCSAHGDDSKQALNVEWFKAGARQTTAQPEIRKDPNERISYVTSTLLVDNAIASDAGHYQCIASNGFSDDKRDTSLMLMTFPDRPGQAYNTWTGVGAVELAWREPPNTGNTPLTSYEIQIEMKGNSIFRPFIQGLNPRAVNSIIYFLQENQEYKFKVIAINAVGKGPPSISSNEIRTIKTNTKRDNLVEDFTLTAVSSDSIIVRWEMPMRRSLALKGYKIVYRNEDKNEPPMFKVIDDYTMLETTLEDLSAGSQYSVQIESNTQVTVSLVVSTVKNTHTFNQRPTEPMECEADRETTSRIVISWNTPENSHGKILQYTIYYKDRRVKDGQWTTVVHKDPQTSSYAMQLIDDGADYDIKISASNSAGEGEIAFCTATGKTINEEWFVTWWFYIIIALVGAFILGVFIVCVILCYRRRSEEGPKMQKIPPVGVKRDDFRGPAVAVYSPSAARNYNPMNTFSGGGMGSPYQSPDTNMKFGGGAGDFRYGTQPKSPDYGGPDPYGYSGNKFNTFDSRATYNDPPKPSYSAYEPPKPSYSAYEPPKPSYSAHESPKSPYEPPRSPRGLGGQDQGSNYDNNTFDSRYRDRDNGSRGYPTSTYDRNNSYGGGGGGNFKSSQL